jgi:hypothetical protein
MFAHMLYVCELSTGLTKISNYIGNRRNMQVTKSVLIGSHVGQTELPVFIGPHKQPSCQQDNQWGP